MEVIKVKSLVKKYKELVALEHLDLTVNEGEIFGLLGPNGSGKSTAINCILSLLSYDKGEIEVFGKNNPIEELSRIADTIPYELTCAVSKRVPRMYIKNGEVVEKELLLRG